MTFHQPPRSALLVACVLLGAGSALAALAPGERGGQAAKEAQRILARARQWAGGAAFDGVRSLSIRGAMGPRGQKQRQNDAFLLRPDRCQIQREGGWVHTLDRSTFWMVIPPDFEGGFGPDMQATAERSTRQNCVDMMTTFLLRPPEGVGVAVASVGAISVAGLKGEGVRVSLPGKDGNIFVFDPGDGRPLGYVTPHGMSSGGNTEMDVTLFSTYRTVNASRFPSHIEMHFSSSRNVVDWTVADLAVNKLRPADFRRTNGGGSAMAAQ